MTVNRRINQSIRLFVIPLLLIVLLAETRAQQIIRDREGGGVIDRVIVIPESEFNISNLERMANAFINQKKGKFKLLLLRVFVKEPPAVQYLAGKGTTDLDYKVWWESYKLWKGAKYPVAETLAFGNSATMRYRDQIGLVSRKILQGQDTFEFQVEDNDFKIVYVSTTDVPPVFIDGPHGPFRVTFSIQTNGVLNEQMGNTVLNYLLRRIPQLDMAIGIRNDAWFIDQYDSPVVSPFFNLITPPTEETYSKTIKISCEIWGRKKLGCLTFGGKK